MMKRKLHSPNVDTTGPPGDCSGHTNCGNKAAVEPKKITTDASAVVIAKEVLL